MLKSTHNKSVRAMNVKYIQKIMKERVQNILKREIISFIY